MPQEGRNSAHDRKAEAETALGMRGAATLLQKLTTASAILFMLTSLALGIAGRSDSSVIDDLEAPISAPTQQELASARSYPGVREGKREAFDDLCWALVNSKEFLYHH